MINNSSGMRLVEEILEDTKMNEIAYEYQRNITRKTFQAKRDVVNRYTLNFINNLSNNIESFIPPQNTKPLAVKTKQPENINNKTEGMRGYNWI